MKRTLSQLIQGALFVPEYFNKLKRIWDELQSLEGFPDCSCGALTACTCEILKKVAEIETRNRVMQFLMGLNDDFDAARNRILTLDPLPNLNKVYSMIFQVESCRGVPSLPLIPTYSSALSYVP